MNEGTDHDEQDLDGMIQSGLTNPIAIALAENLLEEAGIPFFVMDANVVARQRSGNILGMWTVRVPLARVEEAREIIHSVESAR